MESEAEKYLDKVLKSQKIQGYTIIAVCIFMVVMAIAKLKY